MISVRFQGKSFNITVIQVYAPTSNAEEAKVKQFNEDLQDFLELTLKKDVLFITGDWNAKVESQKIPGVTSKFALEVQNETGQRLTEFSQENTLVIAPSFNNTRSNTLFQQHLVMSPNGQQQKSDWLHSFWLKMEKLYTASKNKTRSWLFLRSWTPIAKFRFKLK